MIVINRRYDNHKEHMYRYVLRNRSDLLRVVIPFFETHLLRTSKRVDFLNFARCVDLINQGVHRTCDRLIEIEQITQTMNRQKPRQDLIRILRDYTPDAVLTV